MVRSLMRFDCAPAPESDAANKKAADAAAINKRIFIIIPRRRERNDDYGRRHVRKGRCSASLRGAGEACRYVACRCALSLYRGPFKRAARRARYWQYAWADRDTSARRVRGKVRRCQDKCCNPPAPPRTRQPLSVTCPCCSADQGCAHYANGVLSSTNQPPLAKPSLPDYIFKRQCDALASSVGRCPLKRRGDASAISRLRFRFR